MKGDFLTLASFNFQKGISWQFGPDWPGIRCLAKTRHGTECKKPALKGRNRCQLHGGKSCGATTKAGLERLTAAKIKHGRFTKGKRAEAKHRAEVGRRVLAELKRIEGQLEDAGLVPDN
jgi:hypothetical protein